MHMQQNTLHSIFASIDAQRDALHCESVVKFYPVPKMLVYCETIYPNGTLGVRPRLTLIRVSNNEEVEVDAYLVLKPKDKEWILDYENRLLDYIEYLDDHASFIELKEIYVS